MNKRAKSIFRIICGYEKAFDEIEGGAKLARSNFNIIYEGDLQGESTLLELKNYTNDKNASVYGLERFSGQLEDKSGTFVLEHTGKFENGILTSKRTVVPDSATGGFKGLHGEINLIAGPSDQYQIIFNYYFE
ncbi:MAG: DUF3224 domain-containing protein [Bacteroidota bacterium]|nr:DUF3224 domain-containing protein [Bacteroidota bacterium]